MKAMLVDKEDAVPFLKLLEDIAIGTGKFDKDQRCMIFRK